MMSIFVEFRKFGFSGGSDHEAQDALRPLRERLVAYANAWLDRNAASVTGRFEAVDADTHNDLRIELVGESRENDSLYIQAQDAAENALAFEIAEAYASLASTIEQRAIEVRELEGYYRKMVNQ